MLSCNLFSCISSFFFFFFFFFFNDTATTEIYTLSLHDALPISSWMSPWFQAKLWLVRAGMNAHASGVAHGVGVVPPVAKKNQSGSANGVNVGVRNGSAVIMCSVFISVWSAIATMMLFSTVPVYGFSQLSWPISRSRLRTAGSVWSTMGCVVVPLT